MLETFRAPEVVAAIIGAGAAIIAALILAKSELLLWFRDMLSRVTRWAKAALQWVIALIWRVPFAFLLLTLVGLLYWDVYHRQHFEYYHTLILRRGFPEGIGRLSEETVRRRNATLKFIRRGRQGSVEEIQVVSNRWDCPPMNTGFSSLSRLSPLENKVLEGGLANYSIGESWATCRVEFERDAQGHILRQRVYNRNDRLLYTLLYRGADIAEYTDGPYASIRRDIRYLKFVRPAEGPHTGLAQEIHFLDNNQKPQANHDGGFGVRYIFDERGLPVEVINLGVIEGKEEPRYEPTVTKAGIWSRRITYDEHGNIIRAEYLNAERQPFAADGEEAITESSYDDYGNLIKVMFFNSKGEPVINQDLHMAGGAYRYDTEGRVIELKSLGRRGQLVLGKLPIGARFAKITIEYEDNGYQTSTHWGLDDKPLWQELGFFKVKALRDKRGNVIEEIYLDEKGEPLTILAGFTTAKMDLDDQGNLEEIAYYDAAGRLTRAVEGYAKVQLLYNEKGQIKERAFFGPNGQPEMYEEPYVTVKEEYNEQNQLSQRTFFDKDGDPVRSSNGCATVKWTHKDGNLKRIECFDEQDRPTLSTEGYAKEVREYNPQDQLVLKQFLDLEGNLTLHKDGLAQMAYTYNSRGAKETQTYLDAQGHPILLEKGNAGVRWEYNNDGRSLGLTLLGLDGKPILAKGWGFAKLRHMYKQGKLVEEATYDLEGQLIRNANGYARKTIAYDEFGREKATEFLDVDGTVVQTRITIDEVEPNRKGWRVGLQEGDILLSYDGEQLLTVKQWGELELRKGNLQRDLQIQRAGKVLPLQIPPGRILGITVRDGVPLQ